MNKYNSIKQGPLRIIHQSGYDEFLTKYRDKIQESINQSITDLVENQTKEILGFTVIEDYKLSDTHQFYVFFRPNQT